MTNSVQGVFRDGRVELTEQPSDVPEDTPVVVTFLTPNGLDLQSRGMDEVTAAEIRGSLSSFAEEWDDPSMAAYDQYDEAARGNA